MISTTARVTFVAALLAGAIACSRGSTSTTTSSTAAATSASQPASASTETGAATRKPLALTGTVDKVDAAAGMIAVKNDDVPGWGMPPMTMSYHVSNPEVLGSIAPGDRITAIVYAGDFGKLYNVAVASKAAAPVVSNAKAVPPSNTQSALPPLSYVCPTPGEENEIEDKAGTCAKSAAKLVPVRLVIAYECLKGPAYIQADPGVCRYDKSTLAPITASMFWTCGESTEGTRYLEPGACADGSKRQQHFEKRPHGDHNPRHGGPYVAMSADLLHHAEGTLVPPGVFRAYFYDEYTRPMRVAGYVARLVPTDSNAKEVGQPIPMKAAPSLGPNVMEARVGTTEPTSNAPLHFKMHVTVAPGATDWTSDWDFTRYSKEPGAPATPPVTTTSAPASPPPAPTVAGGSATTPGSEAMGGGAELSGFGPAPTQPVPPFQHSGIRSLEFT